MTPPSEGSVEVNGKTAHRARIDQLPESAKRSLRIAAVIGRQFPVRVLERVVREAR